MPEDKPQTKPLDDEQQQDGAESQESTPARSGLFARMAGWTKTHRLKAALVGVVGLVTLTLLGGAAIMTFAARPAEDPYSDVTVAMALDALDRGDLTQARTWARALAKRKTLNTDEVGAPAYVFGVAAFNDAEESWTKDKRAAYLLAARFLEAARDRGFPPDREARGLLLLGKSLYQSNRLTASQSVLKEALAVNKDPKVKAEIHGLLADAEMRDATPRLDEAMADNTAYLKSRGLSNIERERGLLQRAKILFLQDNVPRCVATLDSIPTDSSIQAEVRVLRGQLLMREARQLKAKPDASPEQRAAARQRYEAAMKTLRDAQGADTLTNVATRQAMYLIGVCLVELGDTRAALEQFQRTRSVFPESPEAFAGDLQEAELNRQHGRDEAAMAGYRRVLAAITDPDNFNNPWFTTNEIRTRVTTAYNDYLRTNHFDDALQLAKVMPPLFPRDRALELTAQTYRQWGNTLLEQAVHVPPSKTEPLLQEGRRRLREAGRAFIALARVHVASSSYPDDLWNAAESYLAGHAYGEAVRILREYLNNESRRRNPRALLGMGETMLALGQVDGAINSLKQCIEFHPTDVASYQARLLLSRAYREIDKTDLAEATLKENLNGEGITPKSEVWQESLFDLGELLHDTGRFEESIRRLEEMVARQPDSPRAVMARYLIADSYRRRAQAAREKLYHDLVENARISHTRQIHDLLTAARLQYETVKELLTARRETMELTPLEQSILRNCHFAIGDALFDLGEYDEAIKAYSLIANRYQSRPEVMQAYLQLYHANRRLGRTQQARRALQHARVVLQRMSKDVPFTETTNSTRQQWEELFNSLVES